MEKNVIRVYYGGAFVQNGSVMNYLGGEVAELDATIDDTTQFVDLVALLEKKLKLEEGCKLIYRVPGKDLSAGLLTLYSDASIFEMCSFIKSGLVEIYVEHVLVFLPVTHDNVVVQNSGEDAIEMKSVDELWLQEYGSKDLRLSEALVVESDYFNSSDYGSFTESSDEEHIGEAVRRKSLFTRFDGSSDLPRFTVGMIFTGPKEFRQAVAKYAISYKKDIKFAKNESTRVRAVCKWPGCPWTLFASIDSRSNHFMVKTFKPDHSCLPTFKCAKVTAKYLATRYEERIKSQPGWKLKDMRNTFRQELEIEVSRSKCRRAKLIVMKKYLGSYTEQYAKLWDYAVALHLSNPGSTIIVKADRVDEQSESYFKRMYICFDACKKGFKSGCRPVIGLDGSFSKGPVKFMILCAVGRDANNQMYPIAWAVVEGENGETWDWFISLLIQDLEMGSGHGYVLISDQQKGLDNSIKKYLPWAEHRLCARHIYSNWKRKHGGDDLKKKFWMCAKSYSISEYEDNLKSLKAESQQSAIDLTKTDPKHWCRAYFDDKVKCEIVDNNLSESFNSWILDARHRPIISMLEEMRIMIMTRIQKQQSEGEKYQYKICPKIVDTLKKNLKETSNCHLDWNGQDGYEVTHKVRVDMDKFKVNRHIVDMRKLRCSCRAWDLTGIPCPHAIIAIHHQDKDPFDFVSSWYTKDMHKKTYSHVLLPLVGDHDWPITKYDAPNPPLRRKMPGRPKKNKRREQGVVLPKPNITKVSKTGTIIRCKLCHKEGHNKTTCSKGKQASNKQRKETFKV